MNLYISDIHFGHTNAIQFDNRPFSDRNEMDYMIIELWNARVQPEDQIYIIGDFAYRNERPEEWYLKQLKGHKHLIVGNHDNKLLENDNAMFFFDSVDKMMQIKDGDKHVCLCHFPMAEWDGSHRGSWHIYGHIHGSKEGEAYNYMRTKEYALNAGCMINNYMPASMEELIYNNQIFQREK